MLSGSEVARQACPCVLCGNPFSGCTSLWSDLLRERVSGNEEMHWIDRSSRVKGDRSHRSSVFLCLLYPDRILSVQSMETWKSLLHEGVIRLALASPRASSTIHIFYLRISWRNAGSIHGVDIIYEISSYFVQSACLYEYDIMIASFYHLAALNIWLYYLLFICWRPAIF